MNVKLQELRIYSRIMNECATQITGHTTYEVNAF